MRVYGIWRSVKTLIEIVYIFVVSLFALKKESNKYNK